ncbi:nuclease-related domain-containing protein [Brachybacterium kimchii]|uniref:NERD domain-containing protein n=1 Tax=Brachybacterium kimchii TaxID=2942909 RepID=A0ABY4N7L7_9MICO|nr:nuclease-related domain-containing protein [Brachybacterium kimchii]UQN30542.1 NERD domain-containing protein [Brachybacterium kimchii]
MSGTVYGVAGGSVEDLGTEASEVGRQGEEHTGRVLDLIAVESQRDVWHDLNVPAKGVLANIDHIVTGGNVALIIDSKRWKPGLYWTLDDVSYRWLTKVEHADRRTMPMLQQRIAAHIPRALVRRPLVSVECSRDSGSVNVRFLHIPGANVVRASTLPRRVRTLVPDAPTDPDITAALFPLLRSS